MSHEDTNTSTHAQRSLSDAKKDRKRYEQDAELLSNRIRLLQIEEQKTWKQIERAQKQKEELDRARKMKEYKFKFKQEIMKNYQKNLELNQLKVKEIKEKIEKGRLETHNSIQQSRKQAYVEVKSIRDQSLEKKYKMYEENRLENKKRSASVKVDHIKQSIRAKRLQQVKSAQAKDDYMKRIQEEIKMKQELQDKIGKMENLMVLKLSMRMPQKQPLP